MRGSAVRNGRTPIYSIEAKLHFNIFQDKTQKFVKVLDNGAIDLYNKGTSFPSVSAEVTEGGERFCCP